MKKHYLFLLCATPLSAQQDLLSPELFDTAGTVQYLQMQAYTIRDALQTNQKASDFFAAEIGILIGKLTEAKVEQSHITALQHAVRRYQVVADACTKYREYPEVLDEIIGFFEKRREIIQEIEKVSRPCVYANLILYNLTHYLGRQPTPAEVKTFTAERDNLVHARNHLLEQLNEKLFAVEKEILHDHRSWIEKYGPALRNSLIVLGALVLVGRMIDITHAKFAKK